MLRIAIVEDEAGQAEMMKKGIEEFFTETDTEYTVTCYSDGMAFLSQYKNPFDIILMDIEMPHMNGLETARKLRKIDQSAVLIFATRMGQFAINGYEVNAIGYMLKPINQYVLKMNLQKAMGLIALQTDKKILIQTRNGIVTLSSKKVEYIEVSGHKLTYHLKDTEYEVYGKISEEAENLREYNFARCSNAYLVNFAYINAVVGNTVILSSGEVLPVSRSMKKKFLDAYISYVSR